MYDLNQEFKNRYDPTLQKAEELKRELDALAIDISFENDLRQLRAKAERVDGEVLCLDSEGEFERAEEKKKEKRGFLSRIHTLTSERDQKINSLKEKISSLLAEKTNIASEILREAWPSIQKEAWARLEEAIDFIDSEWKAVEEYQRETGATATGVHLGNLKIYQNQQRELWQKVTKWVHVPI